MWINGTEKKHAEVTSGTFRYLISDKVTKNTYWRKISLFNKWFWETWLST